MNASRSAPIAARTGLPSGSRTRRPAEAPEVSVRTVTSSHVARAGSRSRTAVSVSQ